MLVFLSPKKLLFLFSSLRNLTRLLYPTDEEDKIKEADETKKDDVEVELKNQFDVLYNVMMMVVALAVMMMMATAMVVMVTYGGGACEAVGRVVRRLWSSMSLSSPVSHRSYWGSQSRGSCKVIFLVCTKLSTFG